MNLLADKRSKRFVMATLGAAGALGAVLVLVLARTQTETPGRPIAKLLIVVFVLHVISWIARLLLTKSHGRITLMGRFPFILAWVKLAAFVSLSLIIALSIPGLLTGGAYGKLMLRSLILGILLFGLIAIVVNSIANVLIVVRHKRGTLSSTSREPLPHTN